MKYLLWIALLLGTLNLRTATAQTPATDFAERLATFSGRNRTIRCDFKQHKQVKGLREKITSTGKFYYDREGRMALRYTDPEGDKILMNGEQFTIVVGGRRLVSAASANPMLAQISYMMQACMSGDVEKLGRGWKSEITAEGNGYRVVLTPEDRRTSRYIASLVLGFDRADMSLDWMQMNEAQGGSTRYEFENKEFNAPLSAALFAE